MGLAKDRNMAVTILIPTDFSDCAEAALVCGERLARDIDASLLIVHVKPGNLLPHASDDVDDPDEYAVHASLDKCAPADSSIPCVRRFLRGNPPDEIHKIAEAEDATLIVMGTHGQTNSREVALGAIAKAVILGSPRSVIAVKPATG
jgi:nucleotide-binding universal stress UspA family protein